jgi:TIGR03009 family protein
MHTLRRPITVLAATLLATAAANAQTTKAPAAKPPQTKAPQTAPAQRPPQRVAQRDDARAAAPQRPAGGGVRAPEPGAGSLGAPVDGGAVEAPRNVMPVAPFVLTDAQQQLLDQILIRWEKQSDKVSTFVCKFNRWEIDPTWGPKQNEYTASEGEGKIKYKSPDRGDYQITKVIRWDEKKAAYVSDADSEQHWICDGKAIFEFEAKAKLLKVRPLPPELQGKSIADGPLPFIFGAKAETLKRRYAMRDVTPKKAIGEQIWLEAWPKYQADAANFQRATVILNEKTFLPEALQIFPPGIVPVEGKPQAYTAYTFMSPSVNNPLDILKGDFLPPRTPLGWRRVVVEDPNAQPEPPASPPVEPQQAKRPAATTKRN